MLDEHVHAAEGRLEGREPVGGLFCNIKENIHAIRDSLPHGVGIFRHSIHAVLTLPPSPLPGRDKIGFEDLVAPGFTSFPTTKCKDLGNQSCKDRERLTSVFVNLDPFGHPRLSERLSRFFLAFLDQGK